MKPVLPSAMLALPLWLADAQPTTPPNAPSRSASAELRDVRGQVVGEAELREDPAGVVTLRVPLQNFRGPRLVNTACTCTRSAPVRRSSRRRAISTLRPTSMGFSTAAGTIQVTCPTFGQCGRERHAGGQDVVVTLGEGDHSLFDADGTALVIHAGPDDSLTDPAGASGDRIACGVLTRAPLRVVVDQHDPSPVSFS